MTSNANTVDFDPLARWCRQCKREAGVQCWDIDGNPLPDGEHHVCRWDAHELTDGPTAITAAEWLATHDAYGDPR